MSSIKPIEDVVCAVLDFGTFIDVAVMMSKICKKTYYHSPINNEFLDVKKCVLGTGIPDITRLDGFMHPDIVKEVDLWICPDIGYDDIQAYLKSIGKKVWGSNGAEFIELYRTTFIKLIKKLGLPSVPTVRIEGLKNLADYLKTVTNKWIKVNRYRENMETWKHLDYDHSIPKLNHLAEEFGGVQEKIVFVVQNEISTDIEIGYDGWSVYGEFPDSSFQGYEKKNELYLGSLLDYDKLPDAVRTVNESMTDFLKEQGYDNFIASEIRWVSEEDFYFIDPTMRMPGQTGEQLLETCSNLALVIWEGANGILTKPEWSAHFAAAATVHYDVDEKGWRVMRVPEEADRWFKPLHYCVVDGLLKFPPHRNDEVGVLLGLGDTIEDAIDALNENFSAFKNEAVSIHTHGFADLIKSIKGAESEGLEFSDQPVPKPEIVLESA